MIKDDIKKGLMVAAIPLSGLGALELRNHLIAGDNKRPWIVESEITGAQYAKLNTNKGGMIEFGPIRVDPITQEWYDVRDLNQPPVNKKTK